MNQKLALALTLTLLISMLNVAFNVQRAKASGTIYIRADGNIDPPDSPISSFDNITYTFTGDIFDSIVIERDSIVVDGAGHEVQGTGGETGIYLDGRDGVAITNATISNFEYGIWLEYYSTNNSINGNDIANNYAGIYVSGSSSFNNRISGNNITANKNDGVRLDSSSNNIISGNNIADNSGDGIGLYYSSNYNSISGNNIINNSNYGIGLETSSNNNISGNTFTDDGLYVWESYLNSVENNTVNGKPLVYLEGVADYAVGDAGQVILVNCDSIRVENLNLSRTSIGVQLLETNNSIISGNGGSAISLDYSSNNSISGNNITNTSGNGIVLDSSSNNIISGNNIADNSGDGIYVGDSSSNSVSGNKITANNNQGIHLGDSSNNSVSGNNITANHYEGISLDDSFNNSISGNNIIDNMNGIELDASDNNSISGNNMTNNKCGVFASSSSNNIFYHNNLINNGMQYFFGQVYSDGRPNVWDDGYPSGGNYWNDYNGTDSNHDGIGDTPYIIDANNTDNYPLMVPTAIPEFPSCMVLLLLMLFTVLVAVFMQRKIAGDVT